MIHLPILRAGRPYRSLQTQLLRDLRDGKPVAEVSQAIPGMIARDQLQKEKHRRALEQSPVADLLAICQRAGELFAQADLPLGEGSQSPEDYLNQLAATSGMPQALGRANMGKLVGVLQGMDEVLGGLSRGLDLSILDSGWGQQGGRSLSYQAQTDNLGLVLPNNSPGVHSLWLPAIPLKIPLLIKPGSAEPWTPYRLAQAFIAAGCPAEAFSFYPTHHAGALEVLLRSGRSLFFGDAATVKGWQGGRKVQIHGPGWSKILLGADAAPEWRQYLEVITTSIAANGGRSCINASSLWTPSHGRQLAAALAEKLAAIEARPLDDPEAQLAAFPDPAVAQRISRMIDQQLEIPGAEDLTARHRPQGRVAQAGGCTFLLPTLIYCEDRSHPLLGAEFIFPFASVVEAEEEEMLRSIGPTLVASGITDAAKFQASLLACRDIDRLNLGPIPTVRLSWDQPHEGNLFDHLYQQRAFQQADAQSPQQDSSAA